MKLEDIKNQVGINFYGNLATKDMVKPREGHFGEGHFEPIPQMSDLLFGITWVITIVNFIIFIISLFTPYFMFIFLNIVLPLGILTVLCLIVVLMLDGIHK